MLDNIWAEISSDVTLCFDYARIHTSEITVNLVSEIIKFGFVVLILFSKRLWRIISNLTAKILGRDDYAELYGTWNVYRLRRPGKAASEGIVDTRIDVNRSWIAAIPRCTFTTDHVGKIIKYRGYCKLLGPNLFFHFNERLSKTEATHDFCYWVKNLGDKSFQNLKYGFLCGVASGEDIYWADVVMSRSSLDFSALSEQLTSTKYVDGSLAKKMLIPFWG